MSFAATCTGVDITSDPADAGLQTVVRGQPGAPERTGTARKVDMTAGEALLVKSQDTVIAAYAYTKPNSCDTPLASNSAGPGLPTTGDRIGVFMAIGFALLLGGAGALLFGRHRRRAT